MTSLEENIEYIYKRYSDRNKETENKIKQATEITSNDIENTVEIFVFIAIGFILGFVVAIIT